jgi:hypothetical protein
MSAVLVPMAHAHLFSTTPWYPDGWVNVLKQIRNHLDLLAGQSDSKKNIEQMLSSQARFTKRDIEEAFDCGLQHYVLNKSGVAPNIMIKLGNGAANKLKEMQEMVEARKLELAVMAALNKVPITAGGCCWKLLVENFEQQLPKERCYQCNSDLCKAGQPNLEHLTQVTMAAGDNTFYKTTTSFGQVVWGLGVTQDRHVNLDLERIKRLMAHMHPMAAISPPEVLLTYVPDSDGENKSGMEFAAEELGMPLLHLAVCNVGLNKMKDTKDDDKKEELVQAKYQFSNNLPSPENGFSNVFIYDDVLHTGRTLRAVAKPLIDKGFTVHYLVGQLWHVAGRLNESFEL